jgi:hypothetical protein
MALRIDVERSGGFAGLRIRGSVSGEQLAPADVEAILDLVRRFEHEPGTPPSSREADRFQYDVTVREDARERHVTVFEGAIAPEERSLLARLLADARDNSRGRA